MRAKAGALVLMMSIAVGCSSTGDAERDQSAGQTSTVASASESADDTSVAPAPSIPATTAAATATTTTTSPPATTVTAPVSVLADPTIAQVVVDGLGYDLCASAAADPALAALLGGEPDERSPRTLDELATALGLDTAPPGIAEITEGAVSCAFSVEGHPGAGTIVKAWTNDSLRYSLGDPSATAGGRAAVLRSSIWSDAGPTGNHVGADLPGVGDGGWSGHNFNSYSAFAWEGPVMLSMSTTVVADTACDGGEDPAAISSCHAERLAPTIAAFGELFPRLVSTFTRGDGIPTHFPDAAPAMASGTIGTASGPRDLCAVAAGRLSIVEPEAEYAPATVTDEYLGYVGGLDVENGVQCEFEGADRDFDRGAIVTAWGDDVPLADDMYHSDTANLASVGTSVSGVGDEALIEFNALYVLDDGIFLYVAVEASALDTPASLEALLVAYAGAVLADLNAA